MKSAPGIHLHRAPSRRTRILCPSCGACAGELQAGIRIATGPFRGAATGRLEGACECGHRYSIPTIDDSP